MVSSRSRCKRRSISRHRDAQAEADASRWPRTDPVRASANRGRHRGAVAEPRRVRRRIRIFAGTRCAAEWVAYAGHRQNRTFLPPAEYNPLAPTTDPAHPTEVPAGAWDVAVFENLFPTLRDDRARPAGVDGPDRTRASASAKSWCSRRIRPRRSGDFRSGTSSCCSTSGRIGISRLATYRKSRTCSRSKTAASKSASRCITRTVRSTPTRSCRRFRRARWNSNANISSRHGPGLARGLRRPRGGRQARGCSTADAHAAAFMPICARYAYEVWVAPHVRRHRSRRSRADERADFARALKTVLLKFDGLWQPSDAVHPGLPTGADRRQSAPGGASPYRVLSGAADARSSEVSRRQRNRRRRVHGRHPARRVGEGTASGRGGRRCVRPRRGARARQPDRRAHGLSRRFCAADGDPAAHTRPPASPIGSDGACVEPRNAGDEAAEFVDRRGNRDAHVARLHAGCDAALRDVTDNAARVRSRVESDVPLGSGLSSSAALEVSLLRALRELYRSALRRRGTGAHRTTGGDGVRRRAGRHHGPDGVQPRTPSRSAVPRHANAGVSSACRFRRRRSSS